MFHLCKNSKTTVLSRHELELDTINCKVGYITSLKVYHWLAHHHHGQKAKFYNYIFGDAVIVPRTLIFPKAVIPSYSLRGVTFVHCGWSFPFPGPFVFSGLGASSCDKTGVRDRRLF